VLGIDGVIKAAHVCGGELASEIRKGGAELREFLESGAANDGNGVVGREIVAVVFEGDEAEGVDEAVGGIAGNDVDLMIDEGAVDEAEVHDARLPGEVEGVAVAPAVETVGTLEEFVADADAPFGAEGAISEIVRRWEIFASSPRTTMAKVFSKPRGSVTSRLKRWE